MSLLNGRKIQTMPHRLIKQFSKKVVILAVNGCISGCRFVIIIILVVYPPVTLQRQGAITRMSYSSRNRSEKTSVANFERNVT